MKLTAHATVALALAVGAVNCIAGSPRPASGDRLVDVPVLTLDGKTTRLAKVIDGRVALVKFGATWCPPCTRQLGEFVKARKAYPADNLAVIDIDLGEPVALVRRHARTHGVNFTTVLDPTSKAAGVYNVTSIPVTLVIGHDGTILYRGNFSPLNRLKPHIDTALEAARAKAGARPAASAG